MTESLRVGDRVKHKYSSIFGMGTVTRVQARGTGIDNVYVSWDNGNTNTGPWNVSVERVIESEAERVQERKELLQEAIRAITKQRNNTYGPPTQDFQRTATINSSVGFRIVEADGTVRELKAHDVAIFMLGLKLSRLSWSPDHKDNWLDTAGYAGCGWECVVDEEREESA